MRCSPAVGAATEPRPVGVHGLIALRIVQRRMDVWRQRHRAVPIERGHLVIGEQSHAPAARVVEGLTDLDRELVARGMHRAQHLADTQPARRPHERMPPSALERTHEEHLDVPARLASHAQPRRNHAGVVDDEEVSLVQQEGKVGNPQVVGRRRCSAIDEQSRRVTRLSGNLRDRGREQLVLECLHRHCGRTVRSHRGGS